MSDSPTGAPIGRICMDVRPHERLRLGDTGIEIEVVAKSGQAARLRVSAPRDVAITKHPAMPDGSHKPSMAR